MEVQEAREEGMALLIAAARQFGLAKTGHFDFDNYNEAEFRRIYRFALGEATRLNLASKSRRSTIVAEILEGPKARLRKHVGDLEAALEASDLPDHRKRALRAKLGEFAAELEKPRSNVGRMLAVVAIVAAALNQAEDIALKLPQTVDAVVKIVGEIKSEELQRSSTPASLTGAKDPKALTGPDRQAADAAEFEDEIPF